MKTFLDKMRLLKQEEVAVRQQTLSLDTLRNQVLRLPQSPSFAEAIRRKPGAPLSLIAEVKAKAPGRQNMDQLDPMQVVKDYQAGGVQAISVLTDESYFGGSLETLAFVHQCTPLPLLHKEFIVTPYQFLEGRIRGASAALLLVYYFTLEELKQMIHEAQTLGLQAVVECSLEEELPRALEANPDILMINNRPIAALPAEPTKTYDLGSVEVSRTWWNRYPSLRQWKQQPGKVLISASCIHSAAEMKVIGPLPYDAALIGNAAMTAPDRQGSKGGR